MCPQHTRRSCSSKTIVSFAICTAWRSSFGYSVEVAADGVSALQAVENALPDLVILDLLLPRMSGFTVAADLAANPRTAAIPIIIVTGTTEPFNEHPFARVLHKPASPDQLVTAVELALKAGGAAPTVRH